MNEFKDKHKNNLGQVQTLMNKFDPCGLIAAGSPVDEYDYLSNKILGLQHRKEPRETIKEIILSELTDYFGLDINSLEEIYKAEFFRAMDKFLDDLQKVS